MKLFICGLLRTGIGAAAALVLLHPVLLFAEAAPVSTSITTAETITVSGLAKVRLTPDRAVFTVSVETTAATVEEAVKQNNAKIAQVIAALKKAGATDKEIQTTNFSIYPQQEFVENKRPRVVGYQVSNGLTVTRENISDAGKLLQAAVDAGANQAGGLSLMVSDHTRGREEGLQRAFQDAKQKAEILAKAAGRTVGRALYITEGVAPTFPQPLFGRSMALAKPAETEVPMSLGTEEVSFTVSVVFELH